MDWSGTGVFFMVPASELFGHTNERGVFQKVNCLRRGYATFFRDNEKFVVSKIPEAKKVEVRFKGLNGKQGRKEAILVRTRTGQGEEGE